MYKHAFFFKLSVLSLTFWLRSIVPSSCKVQPKWSEPYPERSLFQEIHLHCTNRVKLALLAICWRTHEAICWLKWTIQKCVYVCACSHLKKRLCVTSNPCQHIFKYFLKDDDVVSQNWIFYFLLSYQTHIWLLLEGGNKESKQNICLSWHFCLVSILEWPCFFLFFSGLRKFNVTWKKILSSDIHNLLTSIILYKICQLDERYLGLLI